jgi:hypothetical protein
MMRKIISWIGAIIALASGIVTLIAFFFPQYVPAQTRIAVGKFIEFIKANPYGSLVTVVCLFLLVVVWMLSSKVIDLTIGNKLFAMCGLYWNKDNQPFCPKCKEPASVHDDDESYRCNSCGRIIFPSDELKQISISEALQIVNRKRGR